MTDRIPTTSHEPRTSFADAREIDAFVAELQRFERGEIDAEQWRAYRVVRGAYSQRQDGVHMLRIKIPQGIASAKQLRALADVAARWSRGFGHITTRQNFQFHFVKPADLEPALRRLAEAGITTSGAGGNAVRNVVACPFAGVSQTELFDVTPYAEAVTRHFLRHPLASSLPRKFKIAFEGCSEDHVATPIQDLGFRGRVEEKEGRAERGFTVTVAGGTSTLCTSGTLLYDFLPAADVLVLAEAVVRVFHARGDRKNKNRNRLKFLVRDLGFDTFRALVTEELLRVRREGGVDLPFDVESPPVDGGRTPPLVAQVAERHQAGDLFLSTNVRPQRQSGFSIVTVAPAQGDLTAAQLQVLAAITEAYGDGSVRFEGSGHVQLRWITTQQVAEVGKALASTGLGRSAPGSAADVVACPGSEVCRLAVTRTRDVARLIESHLHAKADPLALTERLGVHVSGCPNGCAQHHIAAIGLQGSARRLGAKAVPQYFVVLGGGIDDHGARFGKVAAKIPAWRAPEAVERLVSLWRAERTQGEPASSFFARSFDLARETIADLEKLTLQDARAEDYVEPGATEDFRPDTLEGECAA
jgi:sulfite reductase (NADPH) hemoprotein beta-component